MLAVVSGKGVDGATSLVALPRLLLLSSDESAGATLWRVPLAGLGDALLNGESSISFID